MKPELIADIMRIQYGAIANNVWQTAEWDDSLVELYIEQGYPFVEIPFDTPVDEEDGVYQQSLSQLAEQYVNPLLQPATDITLDDRESASQERKFEYLMRIIAAGIGAGILGLVLNTTVIAERILDQTEMNKQVSTAMIVAERIAQHVTGQTYTEDLLSKLEELYGKEGVEKIRSFVEDLQKSFGIEQTAVKNEILAPNKLGDPVAAAYVYLNAISIDTQDLKDANYSVEFLLQTFVHEKFHLLSKQYDVDFDESIELPTSGLQVTGVRYGALQVKGDAGDDVHGFANKVFNEGLTHSQALRKIAELGFEKADIEEFMMITGNYSMIVQFLDRIFENPSYDYGDLFRQIAEKKGSAVNGYDIEFFWGLVEDIYNEVLSVEDAIRRYQIYYEILNITEKDRAAVAQ